jgi:hypothetical protein
MAYDFVTIDPGIHTGISFWNKGTVFPAKTCSIAATGKYATPFQRLRDLKMKMVGQIRGVDKMYVEGVEVYANSTVSMASATRGNLSLLAYIVGMYVAVWADLDIECEILSPKWKGQLSYDTLAVWIERTNGEKYVSEHVLAAVGMGLYVNGYMQ